MSRPPLNIELAAAEFSHHYWLKEELLAFCRAHGLATAGSKLSIGERIEHFLLTGERLPPTTASAPATPMPAELSHDTVIMPGFRCNQQLRAFFLHEIGPHFHFNAVMRDFIKQRAGSTLHEAIEAWQLDQRNPQKGEIAPQFEYNRHMREFFAANPGATREQAIAAWWQQRGRAGG